ncbi:MAG: S8 family peptidase [Gammaproteobacteria bacterium]
MRIISFIVALLLPVYFYPIYISASDLKNQHNDLESSVSGQWIIVMHDPRSQRRKQRAGGIGYVSRGTYDSDPKLERASRQLAKDYQLQMVMQWPIKSLNVHCLVVTLPTGSDSQSLLKQVKNDVRVESVQAMNEFDLLGNPDLGQKDPYQKMQPSLTQLAIDKSHQYVTGSGISIAVVDSAIDVNHPDLNNVIAWQENFVDDEKILAERHGTGIAGIIAARSNNGIGITGIAPNVTLYGLRACWQDTSSSSKARCNTLTLSRALDRVIDEKPEILNLSLTGPSDPLLQRLLALIVEQKTVVVSAYDEQREPKNRFPQPQNGVLYGRGGELNAGKQDKNSFPAPSIDILTLQPSQTYDVLTGNSLAAAHLSGAVALLLEAKPNLRANELASLLQASVVLDEKSASINTCKALQNINSEVSCL